MSQFSKFYITALIGLSIGHNMSAFDSYQQKEQVVQHRNDVQIDSAANELTKYADSTKGNNEIRAAFTTKYKIMDNTVLDRSYNNENTPFGIDSYYNLNFGFDVSTTIFRTDDLKLKVNSIIDQNSASGLQSSFISVDWARLRDTKLGYSFSLAHTGKSYNPTLQYIMRKGNLTLNKRLTYGWTTNRASHIKRHALHLSNTAVWNYSGSFIESNFMKLDWVLETKSANIFKLSLFNDYNNVGGSFNILRNIEIPSGKYANHGVTLHFELGKPRILKTNFELTARELFNSKGYSLSINPTWNISQNLQINTGLNLHHYRFKNDETLRLVLPFLKSSYTLNPKLAIALFSQYNTETDRLAINSNISYGLKGGHRLDLAYHHNKVVEVANPFLNTPSQNSNILFLKYTYSFAD